MYRKQYQIHFVGVGGIGMSGIAELLLNLGYRVSGSDLQSSDITRRLEGLGGKIFQGHASDQIAGADVVVTSTAVAPDNPEVAEARRSGVPVIPRAEMHAEIMRLKYSVAVAGAHGKTSTTSIVASVLARGGLDPTVVIGGKLMGLGTNAVLGQGDYIVAEADESDGSFLNYAPAIAVVTNIDLEHLDYYRDIEHIKSTFLNFLDRIPFYGLAVLCLDNEHIQDLLPRIKKRCATYGMSSQADFQARGVEFDGRKSRFSVLRHGEPLGEITLNLPGLHNVSNAMASIAVGMELDIPFPEIRAALETLEGVGRRLEIKGVSRGVTVVDDYGHHPTEIKTTLDAVRESWPNKRVVVAFQPHRYSRTRALFNEFTRAFYQSDLLVVLPIYAASETPIEGVDARSLHARIQAHGHKDAVFKENFDEAVAHLLTVLKPDDLLLTLGAGDVYKLGERMVKELGG
ncbi:MAG: UDP-N-acetylmuramate--L-alanine ligase [Desulfobacterales bacterium]|nr:UDP-N-acetylmuramate--L-alanine ligase [Desulfobacterales bacterium]